MWISLSSMYSFSATAPISGYLELRSLFCRQRCFRRYFSQRACWCRRAIAAAAASYPLVAIIARLLAVSYDKIVLCTGVAWLSSVRIVKTEVNSVVTDAIPIVNLYLTIIWCWEGVILGLRQALMALMDWAIDVPQKLLQCDAKSDCLRGA